MKDGKKKGRVWRRSIADVKSRIKCVPFKIDHWNSVIKYVYYFAAINLRKLLLVSLLISTSIYSLLKTDFDSKAGMFSPGSLERYWKRALDDIMKMELR